MQYLLTTEIPRPGAHLPARTLKQEFAYRYRMSFRLIFQRLLSCKALDKRSLPGLAAAHQKEFEFKQWPSLFTIRLEIIPNNRFGFLRSQKALRYPKVRIAS